jgi:hypothetical protein
MRIDSSSVGTEWQLDIELAYCHGLVAGSLSDAGFSQCCIMADRCSSRPPGRPELLFTSINTEARSLYDFSSFHKCSRLIALRRNHCCLFRESCKTRQHPLAEYKRGLVVLKYGFLEKSCQGLQHVVKPVPR